MYEKKKGGTKGRGEEYEGKRGLVGMSWDQYAAQRGIGREKEETEEGECFKVAVKLLRQRRGNILGLIVESWGPAGCAPGL